ncbi:BaiN/RdsA family NAD(P)/FAD-dependent oxidoreductase [Parasporobacterium paucivorans]|uniref:Flavoprotein, HI0933 family n=1 Tax=Parasporobacterium paucivorans DSM 15970 TaxID=1122934 RepID=A0A1M6A1H8_9FIRM|nr:NAD(P)/FAD-dependent oxidoreductase [Parasporobacterium paucivorans]SHI30330.1 hypothetical protein SAMN02745691_00028 [Parasporobacterium paucivorans DSM 15970]
MKSDIIILGGGASGLAAAITASGQGASVTIIEHKDKIGRKILVTGNGRCNLTNLNQDGVNYRGEQPGFALQVLRNFGLDETLGFFDSLGLLLKDRDGYVYPFSDQAAAVSDALRFKCAGQGVHILTQTKAENIALSKGKFQVRTRNGEGRGDTLQADRVILSTGGMAAPQNGSDGSGYCLAHGLGHSIIKPVPALTGLYCKETFFKGVAGVRTAARLNLYINEEWQMMEEGELQLTNYGISGIPVFQISRFVSRALDCKKSVSVEIDLIPEYTANALKDFLLRQIVSNPNKTVEEHLYGILNKKLAMLVLKLAGVNPSTPSVRVSDADIGKVVHLIKNIRVDIDHPNTFEFAQVSAGGVDTRQIHPQTLESRLVPGLYITGELLDIDGACGGYNLQWAWSTGCLAGKAAAGERILYD